MKFNILNSTRVDSPFLSLTLLITGIIILSLQDALIKLIALETSFWQLQLIRSFFNLIFLLLLASVIKKKYLLVPSNWKPVFLRATFMVCCMFCFFAGAPILSISQMAAGLYTFPLFVTILAVIVTKEKIGFWRVLALTIGAFGAALVLEPWGNDFKIMQILPVLAGFFYACNIIMIRKFCRNESPMSLTFAVGIMFFISGLFGIVLLEFFINVNQHDIDTQFISNGWPKLTFFIFLFAIFCSILNVIGNLSLSKAYQNADSSWLAPIDYSYLLFACFWSKVIFNVWPSTTNFIGILLIASAGILTAYREKIKKR